MIDPSFSPSDVPLALAGGFALVAASCRRMTLLRAFSLAAAVMLVAHGIVASTWPSLVLGALLLTAHAVRLVLHRQAVARDRVASARGAYRLGQPLPVPMGVSAPSASAAQKRRNKVDAKTAPKAAPITGFGGLPMAEVAVGQAPLESANAPRALPASGARSA